MAKKNQKKSEAQAKKSVEGMSFVILLSLSCVIKCE